jgi:hypothetical protein
MSLNSTLVRLAKALPVLLANLPAILSAVNDVRQAVKKDKHPAAPSAGPTAGDSAAGQPVG